MENHINNMPAEFEKCVSDGGKVRTKQLKGGKYIHICFINGKSYAGEVKKSKETKNETAQAVKKVRKTLKK